MSSRVADNQISPFFTSMELDDFPRATHGASPSLGQLLKHVGDVRKEATGDGGETPAHHALDISEASLEPRSLPFVLSFNNLTYSVKNRTEFALDVIRELEGSPGGTKSLVEFNRTWQSRKHSNPNDASYRGASDARHVVPLQEAISASISRGKLVSGAPNNNPSPNSMVPTFANPIWVEMAVLANRSMKNARRMPELFGIRLGTVMVTGFILATMFWNLDDSPKGVQERLGFIAFAMSTTFYTCADALPVFLQERYIFMRETAYNAYRRSSYVLSHSLVVLPSLVFLSIAFSVTTFWAVGLDGGLSGFLFYFLIIFASFWAGSSFVTFLSGVVPQVMLGYTIVVAILAYFLLFSGFFITRDRIPAYWIWFHYLSLVKYPYEGVLQNEFQNTAKCFVRGTQIFDNTPLGTVPDAMKLKLLDSMSETLGMRITRSTCLTTGTDILEQQGVTDLSKWNCLWVTVAWGFLFRILFYFALLLGSKNKRRWIICPSLLIPSPCPPVLCDHATDPETPPPEPSSESGSVPDDFDSKLSQVRLRYRSGTGKKAEIRKTKKSKSGSGSSSASNLYLPPVPLKEPVFGGLKVDFGFSPYSERLNGRIAILGLTALLLVELATGKSVLKYHTPSVVLVQVYFVAAVAAVYIKYEKEKVSVWPQSAPPKEEPRMPYQPGKLPTPFLRIRLRRQDHLLLLSTRNKIGYKQIRYKLVLVKKSLTARVASPWDTASVSGM
ncbi:hypothetical protein DVH24_024047 [Malus domestica]|uniref:ABC-2 type transporter transmembrane domain-containing protein n=1 Tax=Malus domestica TaxID=3750 RepID=A0A498JKP2_MALDO|nr:hypothetical protein DVH24_024047 [Malus domestica]